VSQYSMPIGQCHPKHGVRKHLHNGPFDPYGISLDTSISPVLIPSPEPYAQNGRIVNHPASPLSSHHSRFLQPVRRHSPSARWPASFRRAGATRGPPDEVGTCGSHAAADPVPDKLPHD
jgi:hypothetical protein